MEFRDAKEIIRLAKEFPHQEKLRVDLILAVAQLVQNMTVLSQLPSARMAIPKNIRGIFFKE